MENIRQRLAVLDERRRAIEAEITTIVTQLESAPGSPGVSSSLVDAEGFPRADVDIHAVRRDRHRRAVLQTDHERVMKELEEALEQLHAAARDFGSITTGVSHMHVGSTGESASMNGNVVVAATRDAHEMDIDDANTTSNGGGVHGNGSVENGSNGHRQNTASALALVNHVASGSPAAAGGLEVGDLVVEFGSASAMRGHTIETIAEVTATSENRALDVVVMRQGIVRRLSVTPSRTWAGRGLLGCHLIRLPPSS